MLYIFFYCLKKRVNNLNLIKIDSMRKDQDFFLLHVNISYIVIQLNIMKDNKFINFYNNYFKNYI